MNQENVEAVLNQVWQHSRGRFVHNNWGGISGLATAAALKNIAGISSQVIDKCTREEFYNSLSGAGTQLGPNGLRALRAIGGEELMQKCIDSASVLKGNAMILPGMPEPMPIPDTPFTRPKITNRRRDREF